MPIAKQLQRYGRLAAPRLPREAKDIASGNGEADTMQHRLPAGLLTVGYNQVGDLEQAVGVVHGATSLTDRPRMRARDSVNRLRPTTRDTSAKPCPRTVIGERIRRGRFSPI